MTAPKHSPAPWAYEYNPYAVVSKASPRGPDTEIAAFEVFDADGNKVFDTNEDTPAELQEGNARMASAAPRLVSSLITCANLLADYDESGGPEGQAYREAVAAITEAAGRPCSLPLGAACGSLVPTSPDSSAARIKEAEMASTLEELYTYLDNHYMRFDDWGILVALSDDRDAIFFCPLYDDQPERDGQHFNWGQVTAPEPEFLDKVNRIFGTSFRYENFAGR